MPYTREQLEERSKLPAAETELVIGAYLRATDANRQLSERNRQRILRGDSGKDNDQKDDVKVSEFTGNNCYITYWSIKGFDGRYGIDKDTSASEEALGTRNLQLTRIETKVKEPRLFLGKRIGSVERTLVHYEVDKDDYLRLSKGYKIHESSRQNPDIIEVRFV